MTKARGILCDRGVWRDLYGAAVPSKLFGGSRNTRPSDGFFLKFVRVSEAYTRAIMTVLQVRALGAVGRIKRSTSTATDDKLRKRALEALELMNISPTPPPSLVPFQEARSSQSILTDMLNAPEDVTIQLASLWLLRSMPIRALIAEMPALGGSSESADEQTTWRAPEWDMATARIAGVENLGEAADPSGNSSAKSTGKQRMTTTMMTSTALGASAVPPPTPLPLVPDTSSDFALALALSEAEGGSSGAGGHGLSVPPLLPRPEAHILDVLVHAMQLARSSADVQELACTLLASISLELVRGGLDAERGGDAHLDATSRAAMREVQLTGPTSSQRLRTRAYRSGVVSALGSAMRLHADNTPVLHAAYLALFGFVDGDDDDVSEGRHQAAQAGCIELIVEQLTRTPAPALCIWNMGRVLLMAIIRHEPAIRRRAKKALPKWSLEFNLWMLSL